MRRALAVVLAGVVATAVLGGLDSAGADPGLVVTPYGAEHQVRTDNTPIVIDVQTSEGADTKCELYRLESLVLQTWVPCPPQFTFYPADLADGNYGLRVRSHTDGSWRVLWSYFDIDRSKPSVQLTLSDSFYVLDDSLYAEWVLLGVEPSGLRFESRVKRGSWKQTMGDWKIADHGLRKKVRVPIDRGQSLCIQVRGVDGLGNVGEWSNKVCRVRALDETQMEGWRNESDWKLVETGVLHGSALVSHTAGSTLVLKGALMRELVIWGRKGPFSGRLRVSVGDRVLDTVSLRAPRSHRDVIYRTSFKGAVQGNLKLTVVSSGETVNIDAIGISN